MVRNNFQENYIESKDAGHLFIIKQAPGESLRSFFKKFPEVKCQVKGVNEITIINAATCGLQRGHLSERLAYKPIHTATELFDKIEQYAQAKEDSSRRVEGTPSATSAQPSNEPKQTTPLPPATPTTSKPRNNFHQRGWNVYHLDAGQTSEGAKRGGRAGSGRGRGHGCHGGRHPDTRSGVEGITSYCDLHGECSHITADCCTITAMHDYMNRHQQPAEREDPRGADNQLPAPPTRPCIEGGHSEPR